MPMKGQPSALGPNDNLLLNHTAAGEPKKKRGKSKNKGRMPVKDLFGDIMEDAAKALDDEDRPARELDDQDEIDNDGLLGGHVY